MKTPIVSVNWLKENLQDPELIILDAVLEPSPHDLQIIGARTFDIKNKFSDTSNFLPNTLPKPEAFTAAARKLGINKNSKIVVYDTKGIYSSPRAWYLFKSMGHEKVWNKKTEIRTSKVLISCKTSTTSRAAFCFLTIPGVSRSV